MTTASTPSACVASTTVRQLELTINALACSMRKAIRTAEREDPMGNSSSSAAWQQVAQRQAMLMQMMAAAATFLSALAQPAMAPEVAPARGEAVPAPAAVLEEVVPTQAPQEPSVAQESAKDDPLVRAINNLPGNLERPEEIETQLRRIASLKRVCTNTTGMKTAQEKYVAAQLRSLREYAAAWVRDRPDLGLAERLGITP